MAPANIEEEIVNYTIKTDSSIRNAKESSELVEGKLSVNGVTLLSDVPDNIVQFHAGSLAICGGPVYVSDSVGCHNFELLKKLVYPDGTIPKCQHFALPTRDCLFKNPLFDSKTIFKIWNINKFGGVVGAFNCQGAGWDPKEQRIKGYPQCYKPASGLIHVKDVEWDQEEEAAELGNADEYAVYQTEAGKLFLTTPTSNPINITLQPSSFELFSFVPIKNLTSKGVKFAPIGLVNMFNSVGTLQEVEYESDGVKIEVKGGGKLLAFASVKPKSATLDGVEVGFEWSGEDGKLTVEVPWIEESVGVSGVGFLF